MNYEFLKDLDVLSEGNTIDWDDEQDGSEGGYDAHGNFIVPDAMREIVLLRAYVEELKRVVNLRARLMDAHEEAAKIADEYGVSATHLDSTLQKGMEHAAKQIAERIRKATS